MDPEHSYILDKVRSHANRLIVVNVIVTVIEILIRHFSGETLYNNTRDFSFL